MLNCVDVIVFNLGSFTLKNNCVLNILCDMKLPIWKPDFPGWCHCLSFGKVNSLTLWQGMTLSAALCRPKRLSCLCNAEKASPGIFHQAPPMACSVHPKDKMGKLPLRSPCSATGWVVNLGMCCSMYSASSLVEMLILCKKIFKVFLLSGTGKFKQLLCVFFFITFF